MNPPKFYRAELLVLSRGTVRYCLKTDWHHCLYLSVQLRLTMAAQ